MPLLDPTHASILPFQLRGEPFHLLKRGIYDDSSIDVYINAASDFTFLAPQSTMDYRSYKPRHQTLGLTNYKKARQVIESRYSKIEPCFTDVNSVLEIGAAEGAFLAHLHSSRPGLALAAIEPDETTRPHREAIPGLRQFKSLDEAAEAGFKADVICLFHVFEHLADPAS